MSMFLLFEGDCFARESNVVFIYTYGMNGAAADLTTHGRPTHAVVLRCMKSII